MVRQKILNRVVVAGIYGVQSALKFFVNLILISSPPPHKCLKFATLLKDFFTNPYGVIRSAFF